jgi:CubicO group peptidase (beta-lactamase class C family)
MNKSLYACLPSALFFFLAGLLNVQAQTSTLEKRTNAAARKAVKFMNASLPDSVYALAGEGFKKNLSASLWSNIYKSQFSALLPFTDIVFLSSKDSVNNYKLVGKTTLSYYVSLDKQGKLNTFLFQPYKEEAKPVTMNQAELKTDMLARKILRLFNEKKADSIYFYAGDNFKSHIDAGKWKALAENSVFPLVPLPAPTFVSSKNGVNKYKVGPYQFIFSLDKQEKFNTLALQPYQEDAVKAAKVPSDNPLKTHLDSVIDKTLSAYIQIKGNVGLSAGVHYKGKDYYYNYGEVKQGTARLPTNVTRYEIGSITKTFTSTLLAIAIHKGKVNLQTPITRFLPDSIAFNPALKAITLKELANHTSGLPRLPANLRASTTESAQPYEHYGVKQMFSFLKGFKQVREPGKTYEYSNFGAGLLGVILEKVYHKPYEELVKQYITGPANLKDTKITLSPSELNLVAQGYNEQNEAVPGWKFEAFQAAGALKSSASDMLSYGKLQLSAPSTTLSSALKLTHGVTFNDQANIVGLGWHYLSDNNNVLQHAGGTAGFRSFLGTDLKKNIVVTILTNNASTGDALGINLIQTLNAILK